MNIKNKIFKSTLFVLIMAIAITSCQKLTRPALGDYPKDSNPPGGPLKFYAAMDGTSVDSSRANFGVDHNVSYVNGVSGKAVQFDGSKNGYISYPTANDFGSSSDFTVSFWVNATLAQKDHQNADGVLALGNSQNFWGNVTVFIEHENSTSDSMPIKFHFNAANNSDNWQAAGYTDSKRMPHMFDGQWHQIAFTFAAASKTFTLYRDGAQFDQQVMNPAIKFENSSQLVLGGYQEAAGVVSDYASNSWMSGFKGAMDNVRLYSTVLSSTDIAGLYSGKK